MPTFEDGIERNRKVEIAVQPGQVPGALTDYELTITEAMFPGAALELLDSDDPNSAQNGGGDVRVALDADGINQIAIDVVTFITASGGGECEINALATTFPTDAKVWVFYNTGTTASQPSPSHQFGSDNAYRAAAELVLTLNEDPAGTAPQFIDRTSNSNDGTANGGMTSGDSVAGKIGNAVDFDGTDDVINGGQEPVGIPTGDSGDELVISVWIQQNTRSTNANIVEYKDDSTESDGNWQLRLEDADGNGPGGYIWLRTYGGNNGGTPSEVVPLDLWVYLTVVWLAGTKILIYVNGVLEQDVAETDTSARANNVFNIGNTTQSGPTAFQGLIDDLRLYSADAGADFYATRYNNTDSPSTFAVAGTPEDTGGGTAIQPTPYYYMMAS